MPETRDPPPTDEGWYALHDFRTIDWDAWRDAPQRRRERALSDAREYLEGTLAVTDAEAGDSALYSVLGHEADILLVHLRPTSAHIGALERQFGLTEFGAFTDRVDSFVSVTEASGYSEQARGYFEGESVDSGLANYIQTRLKPTIPDATHVCFYPMDKRRDPGQNWYDLSFEERAEHMEAHGDIGRQYGGKVVQMITGAIALDDWEWGVTLWGDDLVDMKDLLYEMRFDPSTSRFAEFGPFSIGRRFPPSDLPALLAGAAVPTDGEQSVTPLEAPVHPADASAGSHARDAESGAESAQDDHTGTTGPVEEDGNDADRDENGGPGGSAPTPEGESDVETISDDDMEGRLATYGLRPGEDYSDGNHALVLHSTADAQDLADEVDGLRGNFEHYDSHVRTIVRAKSGRSAIVSIWTTERAADTAEGFLVELAGVTKTIRGELSAADESAAQAGGCLGGTADDSATDADGTGDTGDHTVSESGSIREELADLDVYAGQPHGEDVYALVLYSSAPVEDLLEAVEELRSGFDRYDTHEGTTVYDDPEGELAAVASLWATQTAANTASEYLLDLPAIERWADEAEGFGTMGMFYTVKPDAREDFVDTFAEVGELLAEMDGHRETSLLVNVEDENDMFIASQWASKDAAMEFFRSDAFAETVAYGREVLDGKPRHVFLA